MRVSLSWFSLLVPSLVGCDTTTNVDTQSSCFGACLEANANVDVNLELEAVGDVTAALEASRRVLGGYLEGAASLGDIVDHLVEGDARFVPEGFSYEGDGQYALDLGDGAVATVTFYWPRDSSTAQAGEPITWDLFDAGQYFTGLSVSTDVEVSLSGVDGGVSFEFDEAGPGAELLGLAVSSGDAIDLDVDALSAAITQTTSSAKVSIAPDAFGVMTELELDTLPTAAGDVQDDDIALTLVRFSGESADGAQTLEPDSADLVLVDGGTGYTGELRFASRNAAFSYDARVRFEASATADVQLGCPGTELLFPDELVDD